MNFKQYRIDRNLTQDQAADLIGMSGSYWSTLEAGQQPEAKAKAFARVLKYLDHPNIDKPLTAKSMHVLIYGLNYKDASALIGAGDSTWSSLANGHLQAKRRWVRSVNALLIELADGVKPDLDLTPGGDIEIIQPAILTPEPEAPMVEEEIRDQALIPFSYGSQAVRCKMVNNDPWWVLRDVCAAIGYAHPENALSLIDAEDLLKLQTLTSGGPQMLLYVSESGLYQFLARVQVESARPFQRWLFKEVLPAIRKTGGYQAQPQITADPLSQAIMIGQALQTFGKEIQAMQARELVQQQKIANLEQSFQQVKYLEIAKTDRSEVLEILQTELVEQKAKDRIEQLNHYRQRKELEKRVSDVAWLAVKAHGGDHGDIIKETNKRIKMAIRGAHGYAIGRERYQDQDFILAYQVVAMIEKEIGDFPRQGEIDFGKDK